MTSTNVKRSFIFNEEAIKEILADYVRDIYDLKAIPSDVVGRYSEGRFVSQSDSDPRYCEFTVTVKEDPYV
jgi:hypothetical protein